MRKYINKYVIFLIVVITLVMPLRVFAIDQDFYDANDIIYYDKCSVSSGSTGGKMSGDSNFAKVVSYFSGNNSKGISIKAEGIAGIISNFTSESALSPFRNEGQYGTSGGMDSPGYGIAQFTPRSKIVGPLQSDPRTSKYFNTYYVPQYSGLPDEKTQIPNGVPVEVDDAWLEVELDFIVTSEFTSTTLGEYRDMGGSMGLDYLNDNLTIMEGLGQAKSASDAAKVFVWIYERPADKSGAASDRSTYAEQILPEVKNFMGSNKTSIGKTSDKAIDGNDVTIIGDSISVGSSDKLKEKLPKVDINAEVGRQFTKGIEIAKSSTLRSTVVFALGTNDTGLTSEQINNLVSTVGKDKTIVLVTNYGSPSSGKDYTSNNNVIKKAAADNSNIVIADWASAVTNDPGKYISSDGIHPTTDGQQLFATTIYNAIAQKSASDSSGSDDCSGEASSNATTVDGHVYPMQGATKANTNIPGLSPQPCPQPDDISSCHGGRNQWSLDLGVKQTTQQQSYCQENGMSESYCYATGGKVVAMADGKFTQYKYDYQPDGVVYKDCASVEYQVIKDGKPTELYWLGHMAADHSRVTGDTFKAGDVIGEVGTPYCTGNGSTAHLHIEQSSDPVNYHNEEGDPNPGIYTLINKLWEALPAN